jgi:hypothetical protein
VSETTYSNNFSFLAKVKLGILLPIKTTAMLHYPATNDLWYAFVYLNQFVVVTKI